MTGAVAICPFECDRPAEQSRPITLNARFGQSVPDHELLSAARDHFRHERDIFQAAIGVKGRLDLLETADLNPVARVEFFPGFHNVPLAIIARNRAGVKGGQSGDKAMSGVDAWASAGLFLVLAMRAG